MWLIIVLVVLVILLLVTNIRVVPQATEFVIERLGTYYTTWETGLHFKVPLVDRVAKRISLKEQVMDFAPQPVITKDNVTMQIDTIVFYQVTDAKLYTYGVERPILAIESLTATTLRNIIGDMELDHTLTSRDVINSRITAALDQATDKWGIKVRTSCRRVTFRTPWRSRCVPSVSAVRRSCAPRVKSAARSSLPKVRRRARS